MSKFHWSISDYPQKSIAIYVGSQEKIIHEDNEKFEAIYEAIKNKVDPEEILEMVDSALRVNKHCNGMFEVKGGSVYVGEEVLPFTLAKKILAFTEEGVDVTSLLQFWKHLSKNPSFHSREQLYGFLNANKVPIVDSGEVHDFTLADGSTQRVDCSGFFVSWKAVRSDYTDVHTGGFDNSPGMCVEMDRSKVNDDPTVSCSSGLHVAAWEYAKNFHSGKYIMVYVNPADVVSVPKDYNMQKMRTCRYYVIEDVGSDLDSVYDKESKLIHSSNSNQHDDEFDDEFDDEDDDYDDYDDEYDRQFLNDPDDYQD